MKYYGKIRDPKDLITLEKGEELVENKITEPSAEGTDGQVLTTDGEGGRTWKTVDSLPEQSGQNGKFLSTDGTSASWANVEALPAVTASDAGAFLRVNASGVWAKSTVPNAEDNTF